MIKYTVAILLIASSFVLSSQQIDRENSRVDFEISNMKFRTVEGSFGGMQGEVNFKAEDLSSSSFNVCIDAASVNTENEKRDEHLRTADFFDVARYPMICFESITLRKTESGFVSKGLLSIAGTTKTIDLPFTVVGGSLVGEITINRYDYKIGADTNSFLVGEDVKIKIVCVLK